MWLVVLSLSKKIFQIKKIDLVLKKFFETVSILPNDGQNFQVSRLVSFSKMNPGYIHNADLSVSNLFKMNINFKTSESEGLIFYGTNREQTDGISLSMKDGHLVLISQKTEHVSKDLFNDSNWHVISIMHTNDELRIVFDDYDFIA